MTTRRPKRRIPGAPAGLQISSHALILPINQVVVPMVPVYIGGEAYLAAHQGTEAAAAFQTILDHPGMVGNLPIGALAHLGLGRAYAMQDDRADSLSAARRVPELIKAADLKYLKIGVGLGVSSGHIREVAPSAGTEAY